mgnify:CR=1 FL=1
MVYDYYKLLGVEHNATNAEIKLAYRAAAKKYHPDVNQGNEKASELFTVINEGYQILSNKRKRTAYDYTLFRKQQGESFKSDAFNNPFAERVSNDRKHRYSNAEILKRKRKRYRLQRERDARTVASFKEKTKQFPLVYRYSINGLLGLTGLVMGYENWFVNYLDTEGFFTLVLSFLLMVYGVFSVVNLAYQHFFVQEITGKTEKDHETRSFKLLSILLFTSILIFYGGTMLKKHFEMKYNADYTLPIELSQYREKFEYTYKVNGQMYQKRQEIALNNYYPKEKFIIKHSKSNPKIAELILIK